MSTAGAKRGASAGEGDNFSTDQSAKGSSGAVDIAKKRIRIMLDDSDEIPPTGHPVSVNGKMYILRAGEELDVPEEVVHVLELAVMSVPVYGADSKVTGYRDRPRLHFLIIQRGA